MISEIKYKGKIGDTWYYGGAYCDGEKHFIIDKNGRWRRVYQLCQWTGKTDREGNDVYEDDLVVSFVRKYNLDGYEDKLILSRIERVKGIYGDCFKGKVVAGDRECYENGDVVCCLSHGKVVGNYFDVDDMDELYENLIEEGIEND